MEEDSTNKKDEGETSKEENEKLTNEDIFKLKE